MNSSLEEPFISQLSVAESSAKNRERTVTSAPQPFGRFPWAAFQGSLKITKERKLQGRVLMEPLSQYTDTSDQRFNYLLLARFLVVFFKIDYGFEKWLLLPLCGFSKCELLFLRLLFSAMIHICTSLHAVQATLPSCSFTSRASSLVK